MEVFSILLGIIFWPPVIIIWLVFIQKLVKSNSLRNFGTLLVLGLPLLAAFSLGKYMFLDEPLVSAVSEENTAQVKSLLAMGADPNTEFKGYPALEQAAGEGNEEIVRLLLAHGARTTAVNSFNNQTALASAQKNGHTGVVKLLKQAGAAF